MGFTAEMWSSKLRIRLLLNNLSCEFAVVPGLAGLLKRSQIHAVILVPISAVSICTTYKQTNASFDSRFTVTLLKWKTFCWQNWSSSKNIRHSHIDHSLGQGVLMSLWNTDNSDNFVPTYSEKTKGKVKQLFQVVAWGWSWGNFTEQSG